MSMKSIDPYSKKKKKKLPTEQASAYLYSMFGCGVILYSHNAIFTKILYDKNPPDIALYSLKR